MTFWKFYILLVIAATVVVVFKKEIKFLVRMALLIIDLK